LSRAVAYTLVYLNNRYGKWGYFIRDFDHVFAIPAYGESPYLAGCIESILNQQAGTSRILLGTSTPSPYLEKIAADYGLDLLINPSGLDIATDWNFVMEAAESRFVTIAHQDDIYDTEYSRVMSGIAANYRPLILAFSDYREHTDAGVRPPNANLKIKRRLCIRAFGRRQSISKLKDKRRLLNLGNPICCPSVMINRVAVPEFRFSKTWRTNLDWDAWLRLADEPGLYVYSDQKLVSKRVHADSETSATIANRVRQSEDRRMFERFWPKPIAALIAAVYSAGYISNRVR
jgi:glycosyltransferase involved in cell wall biosynthesis